MVAPFKPRLMPVPAVDRPDPADPTAAAAGDYVLDRSAPITRRLAVSGSSWAVIENGLSWLKNQSILNPSQVAGFPELASRAAREMSSVAGGPILSQLNEQVRESMARGEGAVEWRKRLEEIANLQAHLAETIQRTATHRAYHEGLDEITRTPGLEDAFPFWEYHATGDNRTRPEHQAMDGKVFHRESPMATQAKALLAEWNCRCTMIPISREDAEAAGIEPGQGGPIGQEGKDSDVEPDTELDVANLGPKSLQKLLAMERQLAAEAATIKEKLAKFESGEKLRKDIEGLDRSNAIEKLKLPKSMRAKVETDSLVKFKQETNDTIKSAADWFGEVLAKRKFPNDPKKFETNFRATKGKQRSHYKPGTATVWLNEDSVGEKKESLVVHEMSHHLEDGKSVGQAGRQFLESRFPEKAESAKLSKLTGNKNYGPTEKSFGDDDFARVFRAFGHTPAEAKALAMYAGKDYGKGAQYTEVISMGMELFYRDPGKFAKVDPDWFKLILGVVRGVF